MVKVTIDGKDIEVPEGTKVLQAARLAGASIPTLCHHPLLTPYGGCRMCLVEVEGIRTLQPSCTLPVNQNMIVHTDTEKVRSARKFVLSLIFSERNHFCMYCQKSGGDCELQNCAYVQEMTHWPIAPNWKPFPVDASHPRFVVDHNRCILCRRCVRACGELVGNFTLAFEDRGANSLLIADLGIPLGESSCNSCGTCVQVCPTGAFIDRASAYMGHDDQLDCTPSICSGCSVGCGINVISRENHLLRIEGNWDAPVNQGVLCEVGRFQPLDENRERILTPLVRKNGELKAATWEDACSLIKEKLIPLKNDAGDGVAALASTRLPAEALYLFKQLFVGHLGSSLATGIEEGMPTASPASLAVQISGPFETHLDGLKSADCTFLIGADLTTGHQVAGFFIKRNLPKGASLIVVDPGPNGFDQHASLSLKPVKGTDCDLVTGITAAILKSKAMKEVQPAGSTIIGDLELAAKTTGISTRLLQAAADLLAAAQNPVIVYGKGITAQKSTDVLKALVKLRDLLDLSNGNHTGLIGVKGEANSLAASQYGLNLPFELNSQRAVFLALGDDYVNQRLIKRLAGVSFLAVQASYRSPVTDLADVVLPVETWNEQEGHFVNLEGRLQKANRAIEPPEGVISNLQALQLICDALGFQPDRDWKEPLFRQPAAVELFEN
ncbi:MAG: molybdopterin-dependent oxidoreductase [Chloroflexi bacterium]|nr:molybdopterin-dependent oxidoreductase [Chloroflexota bacterium]